MMPQYLNLLKQQFNNKISFYERRPGIYQLVAPFFHEDGDMVEIYLEPSHNGNVKVRISDFGKTVMRLSYTYDIDTEHKKKVYHKIISENGLSEGNGIISLDVLPEYLYQGVMQFAQTVSKISSMRYFSRQVIKSMFYEMVEQYVTTELSLYSPEKKVVPISGHTELEVDYSLSLPTRPVYLFAVKDAHRARYATICCLTFQKHKLPFRSMVVHEDFEELPVKDRSLITSAADKQFVDLDDFKNNALPYLEREAV